MRCPRSVVRIERAVQRPPVDRRVVMACASWVITFGGMLPALASSPGGLAAQIAPFWDCLSGARPSFVVRGMVSWAGGDRTVSVRLERFDADSFDLAIDEKDHAVELRRRADGTALAILRHRIVHIGQGSLDALDHLGPEGIFRRILSDDSAMSAALPILLQPSSALASGLATALVGIRAGDKPGDWQLGGKVSLRFEGNRFEVVVGDIHGDFTLGEAGRAAALDDWPGYDVSRIPRDEIERQLCRGARRALEILAPGPSLTDPVIEPRRVANGTLRSVGGMRLAVLHGTPEEIGLAHGELLPTESRRCIDSVLNVVGTVETIRGGRWFRKRLEEARDRLLPHIPRRHRDETRALAAAIGCEADLVETVNVFPELFHCSGFAVSGSATRDGTLYHGRVLDYMTEIGLQDAAVTFVVAPVGGIPFVNVGYAGFTGSVSGMNERCISLGEMGGRGEGDWDGVPMATLMRRALEECSTLDEVRALWERSPRTCEYFYIFADGKSRRALGVAATPGSIEFVPLGGAHARLGDGIPDCIALSAGERLEALRERITDGHGAFDERSALALMARPVAMRSNLHNVLFVPEKLLLHVAHASHTQPACDRPAVRIDLAALLEEIPADARSAARLPADEIRIGAGFMAADSLAIGSADASAVASADERACLEGLCWEPEVFRVTVGEPWRQEDACVMFPSPRPLGDPVNDTVAMEWYVARGDDGKAVRRPACIVVHESGSGMHAGRLVARGLHAYGVHTFLVHLPWYGRRRPQEGGPGIERVVSAVAQAVGDVRRARDAVAALPIVDAGAISVQGTSLGGFVTATAAALDRGFDQAFIFLAGGDLAGIVAAGRRDAAKLREKLEDAGMTANDVARTLESVEPLRIARRLDPLGTWLYSGRYDDVVPPRHARLLAEAAGLDETHHVELAADHYSGIVYLPYVLAKMHAAMIREGRSIDASAGRAAP